MLKSTKAVFPMSVLHICKQEQNYYCSHSQFTYILLICAGYYLLATSNPDVRSRAMY